jgi:hypothetical protein
MNEYWLNGTDGKAEVLKENPVPVPLCSAQLPYRLPCGKKLKLNPSTMQNA